ncbi:glycosyltransferase [Methanosarcina acetivorans C2A]|uniref:Glycosyltransferase n=2 Tax=Methanosarcina acetivorans TaxID=2214 RepID=Q8TRJ6_METAC|nr:glycosyltransferase [Methanosarcina acetivorans C2A]
MTVKVMKIAIVAPSPVPFTLGGAELLFLGMQSSINKHTSHQCELIKVPIKENSFWDLIESYYKFYQLDLSHFDMVISTKYPSWMLKHDNHTVYMVHHLRGLFDTYHFCNEAYEVAPKLRTGLVKEVLDLVHTYKSEQNVDRVFERLFELKKEQKKYDNETFRFPGPFIRQIIHFFDEYALAPERVDRYLTMSNNVKKRANYFPLNVQVDVNYPPSKIENFECNSYSYLFTASRLDGPKRIDLLIKAMKHVPHNVKLKIAGTGPDEDKLKKMAENDLRIEFLDFVSEDELIKLYSDSLAVLFVPFDEDYGLITIEGMMSKKPVITTIDSGGPLEFVKDSETGYIVESEPQKIAEKINYLIENPEIARKMGFAAYQSVKGITWKNFSSQLVAKKGVSAPVKKDIFSPAKKNIITSNREKILVLATYSCYPPRGGGQHRLYNIYSLLAKEFDVTICSIIEANKQYQNLVLDNGLKQICIPQSTEHARYQWEAEKKVGANLYDVAMIDFVDYSKEYVGKIKELAVDSDIVVFSHPYLWPLNKFINKNKKVIYEAHNLEYLLKKDYVKDSGYITKIYDTEKEASLKSDLILCTSEEDKQNLIEVYGANPEKILVTPNGVDTTKIHFIKNEERKKQKELTGLSDFTTIIFVGSWHPPNLEALKFITDKLCRINTKYKFLVVGSVKDYYLDEYGKLPRSVLSFGTVDEDEKYEIYKLADIAINPMFSGSGTNLKMLDYMSAGIPVVSTSVGARGLDTENEVHALICPAEEFQEKISVLLVNEELQQRLKISARNLVERKYSWEIIAQSIVDKLKEGVDL